MIVLWGFVFVFGASVLTFVAFASAILVFAKNVADDIQQRIIGLIVIVVCVFAVIFLVSKPSPYFTYLEVGTIGAQIVVDRQDEPGETTGNDIRYVNRDHKIIFTEDLRKFGDFKWAFGWREYRNIQEDIKEVIRERDGFIYFISKSTGKMKTITKK